ncbi:DUF4935 domain-containing protein [Vibrio cholerae]|nr:DUF4935 domain-containing protein [Vibrio cholerae]EJL6998690.1 DUF4935 domain-containing protein [Vibrio cholerae]
MNVFIDTNIFFTFYSMSSEKIEELKKALVLHKESKITLWLPEIVVNEFWRNRASEVSRCLSDFESDVSVKIPQIVKDDARSDKLVSAQKDLKRLISDISKDIKERVKKEELDADLAVKEIFANAKRIESNNELIEQSMKRYDLGNPPGKKGSYGDALNWESLLKAIPHGEDIHIISDDGDFYSPLDKNTLNEYLAHEWNRKKGSEAIIYKRLTTFISNNFPEARSVAELERNIVVEKLEKSGSFSTTHTVVSSLNKLSDFNQSQVIRIIEAYMTNQQVNWIATDPDLKAFAKVVIDTYAHLVEPEKLKEFKSLTGYA